VIRHLEQTSKIRYLVFGTTADSTRSSKPLPLRRFVSGDPGASVYYSAPFLRSRPNRELSCSTRSTSPLIPARPPTFPHVLRSAGGGGVAIVGAGVGSGDPCGHGRLPVHRACWAPHSRDSRGPQPRRRRPQRRGTSSVAPRRSSCAGAGARSAERGGSRPPAAHGLA
jgi:hypothetical protein